MRATLRAGLAVALVVGTDVARAEVPCDDGAGRVDVTIEGGSEGLATAIRQELDTELARAKLCSGAPRTRAEPLAHIRIVLHGDTSASIHIADAVTRKIVEREVDVAELPIDGRALPIAIAADELLHASWVEINLRPEVEDAKKPLPPVVRALIAPPKTVAPFSRALELGVRATVSVYGGGQTHLGGALYVRRDFTAWASGEAFGYAREAVPVTAPDGSIRAHAWGGGLSLDVHFLRVGVARFGVKAGAEVGYVLFEGSARADAHAASFGGASSFGHLGLAGAFELKRARISAAILGLAPFRSVEARDGAEAVTRVGGFGVQASLGAGVSF